MPPTFDTAHLDHEMSLPDDIEALTVPDLYVGLEIPLLAPGDGIVTDRRLTPLRIGTRRTTHRTKSAGWCRRSHSPVAPTRL